MMKNTGQPPLARFPGISGTVIFALVFALLFDSSPVFSQSSAPVRFQSFDLGELRGRVAHEAFVPLSGKPVTGATHTAVATLTGSFQTAQFRMVSLTGIVIRPLTLPAPSSGGTLSGFGEFSGPLIIPNQPFQVAVNGVDTQNAPYDIIHPKVFLPQTIEVNFDRSQLNKSGNTSTVYADVTNHGASDTFVIEVSEEHVEYSTGRPIGGLPSFISRVAPATLTLNTGQTGGVEVDITPPSGVPLDSGVKVRLVATNNDDVLFPAVIDTVPPTVTPPSDITVSATGGLTVVAIGLATASDNVAVYSLTSNSDGLFPVGTTVVTWVALDAAGNMGTATQNITVNSSGPDTTPPNITAPPPVTVVATGSQTAVSIGTAAATDNVSAPANILITNNALATFPVGGTTVTWTATDEAGNFANATQIITVNQPGSDTTPPNITPPSSVTTEATGPQTSVSLGTATATDNVSAPANILITNNAPATFPVGGTTVTWTATDEAGNFATATQTVTIADTTSPAVIAPPNVTTQSTGSQTPVDIGVATASDAVGVVLISNDAVVTTPPPSFPAGTTVVTWIAQDAAGNVGTATQIVIVTSSSSSGGGDVVDDSFTGESGDVFLSAHTPDTTGAGWVQVLSTGNCRHKIDASEGNAETNFVNNGSPGAITLSQPNPASPDYDVAIETGSMFTQNFWDTYILGRYQDNNNYYAVRISNYIYNKVVTLYKYDAGVRTTLGQKTVPAVTNSTITLEMRGAALKVLIGGAEEISVVDGAHTSIGSAGIGSGALLGLFGRCHSGNEVDRYTVTQAN